ncbi:MAG: helix-turn-helix domain-containing protein [Terriglobales bacterium]
MDITKNKSCDSIPAVIVPAVPPPFIVRDQKEPGWFHIDNEIIDNYGPRVGPYALAVYTVLCRKCERSTQEVPNLSQRDIAVRIGISQAAVGTSLGKLEAVGLIHRVTPDHPAPGMISRIFLLRVKALTERHTFSSTQQRNATHSVARETERQAFGNKEVKIKTETERETQKRPPLSLDQEGETQRVHEWAKRLARR